MILVYKAIIIMDHVLWFMIHVPIAIVYLCIGCWKTLVQWAEEELNDNNHAL